jgi:hypothetical protein
VLKKKEVFIRYIMSMPGPVAVDDSYCCEYLAIFVGENHSIIDQASHYTEKIILFCTLHGVVSCVFHVLLVRTSVSGYIVGRTRTNVVFVDESTLHAIEERKLIHRCPRVQTKT